MECPTLTPEEKMQKFEVEVREILHRRVWNSNGECQIRVGRVVKQAVEKLGLARVPHRGTILVCRVIETSLDFEIFKDGPYGSRVYQTKKQPIENPKEHFPAEVSEKQIEWWESVNNQLDELDAVWKGSTQKDTIEDLEHLFLLRQKVEARIEDCKKAIVGGV